MAWLCKTAWRDSRGSRKRLLLAVSAITFGVAALVAITSFGANVREAVNNQAKLLLGADLVLSSRQPFTPETEALIASLGGALGDQLVFDIQGIPVTTTVSSIRKVDWQRVQPNFFLVFPSGVLETAPQTYVLVSRVPSSDLSAAVQRTAVQQFPNVSAIDLTLVLHTLDAVLGRVTFAIRFMAFFSLAAGIMVLANAVFTSRYQRLQESAVLRTLGASRVQIRQILLIEYLFLGSLAAVTGLLLAVVASWALAYYLFETTFVPAALLLVLALFLVIGLTILIGTLGSRGVVNRPPLAVLRSDS